MTHAIEHLVLAHHCCLE